MAAPLLAVAVHDASGARLEPTGLTRVQAREACVDLRVSYRLDDSAHLRDFSRLTLQYRLDGGSWKEQRVALVDVPGLKDDLQGSLPLSLRELEPGRHELEYKVRLDSATAPLKGGPWTDRASAIVDGAVRIDVA